VSRDERLLLSDIERSCAKVITWTSGLTRDELLADEMRYDAVLRNLQIIGEAVKQLSAETRTRYPAVPWQRIAGFRDVVTHAYFGIDEDIVWDIIQNKRRNFATTFASSGMPGLVMGLRRVPEGIHGATRGCRRWPL
jgi:uncharacterized protein with HEPN domain